MSLDQKAIRGIPWTGVSYGANKLLTLATTLVLARLLTPEDFGLIALAFLVIGLLSFINDLGLGSALIVRPNLDDRAKGTILSAMVIASTVVAAVVAALSPLAAAVFDEPELTGILAVLATLIAVDSVTWFYDSLMQRELEFKRRFAARLVQTVLYALAAIPLAAIGLGVWSIVLARVVSAVGQSAASLRLTPYRVRPAFDVSAARDAFVDGRGFLLQGAVEFASQNADYLAVGRTLGASQLGYYSMGYRLAEIPYSGVAEPVAEVTFPSFAQMRHRREDPRRAFLSTLRLVALLTCPMGLLLSATAAPFVETLLGDKWLPMIAPLSVLGIWAAVRPVEVTIGWVLNSLGHAGLTAVMALILLVFAVPAVFVAADLGGLRAVAWVMLANSAISLCILSIVAQRRGAIDIRRQWRAIRPVAIAAPATWVAGRALSEAAAGWPPALSLSVSAAAALCVYAAALSLVEPGIIRQAVQQIGEVLGRPAVPAGSA